MCIERKPAREVQIDYVGDNTEVLDAYAREMFKAYAFAARLPYSRILYAESFFVMREKSRVEARMHAFAFLGSSMSTLALDNLKQSVAGNAVDEQNRRMAEQHGCAVAPSMQPL